MVFSSLTFLFSFLPAALVCYYLTPQSHRNLTLLLVSLLFYAWGEPRYIVLMLYSTLLDYTCGRMIERHRLRPRTARIWLGISLIGNLGLLVGFKYADWLIGGINQLCGSNLPLLGVALPIGISFYTFQTMSYTIDVYRGDAVALSSLLNFGAYVSLFPQLIAGPIVRYADVAKELAERVHSWERCGQGARRFVIGLGKKVLIANSCGLLFDQVKLTLPGGLSLLGAWLGIFAFSCQIYFDFSGYSDMAIGLGQILGFTFPENFHYPFISESVTEFWRRWHITLGSWFRDYVYIPLGGNRKGPRLTYRNLALVWLLTGLWHGAAGNFLWWGTYFAIWLIWERCCLLRHLQRAPRLIRHLYTLLVVAISFVLFAFPTLGEISTFLQGLVGLGGGGLFVGADLYLLSSNWPLLGIAALAATPLPKRWALRWLAGAERRCGAGLTQGAAAVLVLGLLLVCTAYLVDASYNPFLYFRF